MFTILKKIHALIEPHVTTLCVIAAFFLPLRLLLVYSIFFPLLIYWLIDVFFVRGASYQTIPRSYLAFFLFICVALVGSIFGLEPLQSIHKLLGLLFFFCIVFPYREMAHKGHTLRIVVALIAGQTIAALHSVFEALLPHYVPRMFLGQVTESGQLALTLIVALGLTLMLCESSSHTKHYEEQRTSSINIWDSFGTFTLTPRAKNLLCAFLMFISLPLLCAALIINMKRGPWCGVLVGGIILIFLFKRRLILPALVGIALIIIFVQPVRTRLEKSREHFFISGGRSALWQIGGELATRYPLGLGYDNSPFLRKFSPQIPPELKHFHSNFLNILVETGWIGLGVYLWWIFLILKLAFMRVGSDPPAILPATIGCAIISWQTAGLVEYNFGDSEVLLVALVLIGVLGGIQEEKGKVAV